MQTSKILVVKRLDVVRLSQSQQYVNDVVLLHHYAKVYMVG